MNYAMCCMWENRTAELGMAKKDGQPKWLSLREDGQDMGSHRGSKPRNIEILELNETNGLCATCQSHSE